MYNKTTPKRYCLGTVTTVMKITQEADYALRICTVLSAETKAVGAPQIAEAVHIPSRFAMKILRKLSLAGIVRSTRGVAGGYSLSLEAKGLSLLRVIEAIDGKTEIRNCLCETHNCSHNADKKGCRYHCLFAKLNEMICQRLERVTVGMVADEGVPLAELLTKLD